MDDIGPSLSAQAMTLLPLVLAAVGWYISSRLAVNALARRADMSLRRGLAQVIPVAIVAVIALLRHQPQIAIGVVFASSVAALSLAMGVITLNAPPQQI